MLSAPAAFDQGFYRFYIGFIPYVICSSLFFFFWGGCLTVVFTLSARVWFFVSFTPGCNFSSLKNSSLFLIVSLYILFNCAHLLLLSLKSSVNSWQAFILFLLHGVFEVSLHLEKAFTLCSLSGPF